VDYWLEAFVGIIKTGFVINLLGWNKPDICPGMRVCAFLEVFD